MTDQLRGPWKLLPGHGGTAVPLYIVTFDKAGTCTAPRTLDDLVATVGRATDVFLFSHGWNNDWQAATERYLRFAEHFSSLRETLWATPNRAYEPVLCGVYWPSMALVSPTEAGPDFAGPAGSGQPAQLIGLTEIAAALGGSPPARLYELAQRDRLGPDEALEFAAILAPALAGADLDLGRPHEVVSAEELVKVWAKMPAVGGDQVAEPGGFIEDDVPAGPAEVAGLGRFDPRQIVRAATVLLMKDRAGRVGAGGVGEMLRRIVDASSSSRVHLVGHSYGAKVVLSAMSHGPAPSRPIDSVLLLQPAMSALCFAPNADGHGSSGGYRPALDRTRQAVLTTFSSHDVPLTKLFHLAVRRSSDLGEAVIAGAPPSRFAALGGFGPQGMGAEAGIVDALEPPHTYDLSGPERVVGLRADDVISSHGGVENAATAWALLTQVRG